MATSDDGSPAASEQNDSAQHDAQNKDGNGKGKPSTGNEAYWRANLKLGAVLMTIWFVVSFGFGILLVEPLNAIPFFGFKLGFWWAQQGAI
ncbi:MAG: DUF4212 domain-containing protein, partial [Pseudomonadota bacterium]